MKICKVKGCNNNILCKNYCNKHYLQMCRYGKILERTRMDKNEIIDCGDYLEICLYNIKHQKIARTKIDKNDLEKIKKHKWSLSNYGYTKTNKNINNITLLHQFILGKKQGYDVDHKNTNKLDNRKQNLRYCTKQQNNMNIKVKGYTWNRKRKKWIAQIGINYKNITLGYFENKQDAINARRQAEKKYFKEFAFRY